MKRRAQWLLAILLLILTGCGGLREETGGYTVRDGFGQEVHLARVPQRIYANTMNLDDLVLGLAGPSRLLAVSRTATADESLEHVKARQVAQVADGELSAEQIVALQPDLIIFQERDESSTRTLRDLGIPVLALPVATTREMVNERIALVAAALREEEKGREFIRNIETVAERIRTRLSDVPQERRPIVLGFSGYGAFGSSKGVFHQILTDAGVQNGAALAGLNRSDHLTKEAVIALQPDYFLVPIRITVTKVEKGSDTLAEELRNDPAYADLPVIRNDGIITVPDAYLYCNSQHYADAIRIIHEAIYGPLP